LAAIIIGSLYLYFTLQMRTSSLADTVGPAGVPRVLGILMILLGIVLCVQSFITHLKSPRPFKSEWTGQPERILRAAGLLLLAIGYLVVVNTLGYTLSVAILIMLAALYLGARFSWRVPAIAAGGALSLWLIFAWLLGIAMPAGIF
jgi:putative tricarboxylic transport membrane protein